MIDPLCELILDPDLWLIVDAWPTLSLSRRAAILQLLDGSLWDDRSDSRSSVAGTSSNPAIDAERLRHRRAAQEKSKP